MPKCLANKLSGGLCQNNAIKVRNRCKFHGGMSLRGEQHWNYQSKGCANKERLKLREANAHLKLLKSLAIELGLISA